MSGNLVSKSWIREKELVRRMGLKPLVMAGEPMLYSIKYSLGERRFPVQFFRNKKWRSKIRCWFSAYISEHTAVAVIICCYVSPQFTATQPPLSQEEIESEQVPAVYSWELADLELSYLEMLKHALLKNYRQVTKIDICKFYSNNPRTLVQILPWCHYVNLQDNYPYQTKSESIYQAWERETIQSELQRYGSPSKVRKKSSKRPGGSTSVGPNAGDSALCLSATEELQSAKKGRSRRNATLVKTRRRQSREIHKRQLKQDLVERRLLHRMVSKKQKLDKVLGGQDNDICEGIVNRPDRLPPYSFRHL